MTANIYILFFKASLTLFVSFCNLRNFCSAGNLMILYQYMLVCILGGWQTEDSDTTNSVRPMLFCHINVLSILYFIIRGCHCVWASLGCRYVIDF